MIERYRTQLKIASIVGLVTLAVPHVTHADVIGGIVYFLVIKLFGMFVSLGALLLNFGIDYFVIGFGGTFNNSGIGVAVNDTWAIIRDFVNLGFIFGLVYIGIKMILDSDSGNTRRWLVNLILAALLVNFSLFATKFAIDIGNRLAAEIAVAGLGAVDKGNGVYESNVGGQLMVRMGLTSVFNSQDGILSSVRAASDQSESAPWGYIFGIAILFMVAAFVFAAGGLLLIVRFVVLIIYLITSPLMFAGWVIPGLSDGMRKYWRDLLSRVFFAPIYFVFLYFSFQVMDGLQKAIKGPAGTDTTFSKPDWGGLLTLTPNSPMSTTGTLPFFILICVLLVGSLRAASKLGAEGADKALKIGKGWSNKIQNGARNTARAGGRGATGWAARGVNDASAGLRRQYNDLTVRAQNSTSTRGRIANRLLRGTDGVTQATLCAGENASVLGSETRAQQTARREAYQQRVRQTENTNQRATRANTYVAPIDQNSDADAIDTRINTQRQRQQNLSRMNDQELLTFIRNNRAQMDRVRALAGESGETVEAVAQREGVTDVTSRDFLALLSDAQMSSYENSGMMNNPQIQEARRARDEGMLEDVQAVLQNSNASSQQLTEAMDRFGQLVQGLSGDRLHDVMARQFTAGEPIPPNVAATMTAAQFDTYRNSGRATREQVETVRQAREVGLNAIATHGNLAGGWMVGANNVPVFVPNDSDNATVADAQGVRTVRPDMDRRRTIFRNAQEAGRMPASVLSQPNIAQHLTPQVIEAFMNNNPSDQDINDVRENIRDYITRPNDPEASRSFAAFQNWQNRTNMGARFDVMDQN